jgi:hypothetical protein
MYLGIGPVWASVVVEHPRWPLRTATTERLDENMLTRVGLPSPEEPPMVHFSDGVDARIGWPRPAGSPRDGAPSPEHHSLDRPDGKP